MLLAFAAALFAAARVQQRFGNSYAPVHALLVAVGVAAVARWLRPHLGSSGGRRRVAGLGAALGVAILVSPVVGIYAHYARNVIRALRSEPLVLAPLELQELVNARVAAWLALHTPETAGYLDPSATPEYGVLGPWSLGHVVQWIGRRPTVLDNFGDDVGSENLVLAEGYFSASAEARALAILQRLRARYVLANASGAGLGRVYGPETMAHRLSVRGGAGEVAAPAGSPLSRSLVHHRLVFETAPLSGTAASAYRLFEIVRGARIEGRALPGAVVSVRLPVRAQGRPGFAWTTKLRADADGRYELRVPYPNEAFSPAVRVGAAYRIESAGRAVTVSVTEAAVQSGSRVAAPPLRPHQPLSRAP
jgi:asparagine N-glycosylation enzyme membrane subunit Stt3